MSSTIFNGTNWNEYEIDFAVTAMKRGRIGLAFIKIRCCKKYFSLKNGANVVQMNEEENMDDRRDKQDLFADILTSITPEVYKRLKQKDRQEVLVEAICTVDHVKLWDLICQIGYRWGADSAEIDQIVKCRHSKYGVIHGVWDMFTGRYVLESWKDTSDPGELQGDIVMMTANVALVGALVLTMAIPMFVAVDGEQFNSSSAATVYVLLLAVCGILEGTSVLVCIRNLLVINLVNAENMTEFIRLSASVLIVPMRLNFLAIVAMGSALICYSLWQFGYQSTVFFSLVVIIPSMVVLLYYIGKAISDLNAVQGWGNKGVKPKIYADN